MSDIQTTLSVPNIDIQTTLSIPNIKADFAIFAAGTVWGSISGDLADQEDLQAALDAKENVINADNKINADFIDDTDAVNKFVTTEEIATWNAKQNAITGAASTVTTDNLTASRTLVSSAGGKIIVSDTTTTELGYVHGVTSNIQVQLNSKQAVISDLETIRSEASTALKPNDNITQLTNNAGYITKSVNDLTNYTTTADLNTALGQKQDTISDLSTIRAGAAAGATALQAENYGTILINI